MSSLIFGVNTVLPIFLLILLGMFLKKIKLIKDDFVAAGTSLVYYCALPVNIFQNVAGSDFQTMTNVRFILYIVGVTLIGFLGIWLLAVKLCPDKEKRGSFIHAAFRGNYVYVGLPITQSILSMDVVPCTALVIAFVIPLYNVLGVLVLTVYNQAQKKINVKKLLIDIFKNPLIIAVLVAIPFSFFRIQLPGSVHKALDSLGDIASPLALLFIGASIRYQEFLQNLWLSIKAAILKVVIQPLLFVPLAVYLGFNAEEVVTCYVMLAVPTAMNAYIVARKMGGDEELSSGIIVATIFLSVVTVPVGVMLLKGIGLI